MELQELKQYGIVEKNNKPLVGSRKVADKFERDHFHVLRNIESLTDSTSGLSEEFIKLNFIPSSYKDSTGRKLPEWLLTKDGFTMVVMEFKTKKARAFKESYIKAFNQMESFIKDLLEAKADFPEFTDAILQMHEQPKPYYFSNECNMINQIVTGMTAKQFKEKRNVQGSSIRPYLTPTELEAIKKLQRFDIGLIVSVPDFQQRKIILTQQFNRYQQKLSA